MEKFIHNIINIDEAKYCRRHLAADLDSASNFDGETIDGKNYFVLQRLKQNYMLLRFESFAHFTKP